VNKDTIENNGHQVNATKTTNLGKLACEYDDLVEEDNN
jgi:hypothetical protein